MSLFVIGLNHRTAPVEIREGLAFPPSRLNGVLPGLPRKLGADGVVVLSTCNRTEFYVSCDDIATVHTRTLEFIKTQAKTRDIEPLLYAHENEAAVQHLFRVASGLDSMVVGEQEILGQVKQAYQASHTAGCTDKWINVLFQRCLYVGKRVRTETGLSLGSSSVANVAVILAERIFGDLHDRQVMILGAGKMAEQTAKHLLSQKVRSLLVSNRTYEKACEVARQFGGRAIHFEEALQQMEDADIIICSTAAPHPVIKAEDVSEIMQRRKGRSLFFIDIAMPRDVHPDVHRLDNVYVYDIDDLQAIVAENITRRSGEIVQAEKIIREKSDEFTGWLAAQRSGQPAGLKHYDGPPARKLQSAEIDR
jgi:glutamyl-tRNA reductase